MGNIKNNVSSRRNLADLHKQTVSLIDVLDTKGLKKNKEYSEASRIDSYIEGNPIS